MCNRRPAGRYLAGSLTLASALTAGITGLAPADAAVAACSWTDGMQPPRLSTNASFKSVAVPSASQAWAVGTTTDSRGATHALIEHWNGSAWSTLPVPRLRSSSLLSVRSASSTSAWSVGTVLNARHQERALILHWNGKVWAQQPSPNPGTSFDKLDGVRIVSPASAWAVGTYSSGGPRFRSLILHWNGTAWKQVNSPNPCLGNQLAAVAATSGSNAWAVGLASNAALAVGLGTRMQLAASADPRTFILHWNGRTWSQAASPSPGAFDFLEAVGATSATNAWAVGSTGPRGTEQTLILHWNGRTWRQVASPNLDGSGKTDLHGVTATSATNAWAVGSGQDGPAFILRWDGHRWQPGPALVLNTNLNGVAASSAGNAWAVGDVLDGTVTRPLALHCGAVITLSPKKGVRGYQLVAG